MIRNILTATLIALLAGGIDWFSKFHVLYQLQLRPGDALEVIPGILTYVMSWNHGINFGLFADEGDMMRYGLAGLAIIISVALMIWAARRAPDLILSLGVGLVVGGALGNAYDRIVYGAVADFLNVTCCGIRNPFAFNIADIAIFLGAIILLIRGTPEQAGTA